MVGSLQVQSKNEIFQSYAKHHPCHKIYTNKKRILKFRVKYLHYINK
jgi:hypothetical protein